MVHSRKVPKLLLRWIESNIIAGVCVPSNITHPDIISLIGQNESCNNIFKELIVTQLFALRLW